MACLALCRSTEHDSMLCGSYLSCCMAILRLPSVNTMAKMVSISLAMSSLPYKLHQRGADCLTAYSTTVCVNGASSK